MKKVKDLIVYEPHYTFKKEDVRITDDELALLTEKVTINGEKFIDIKSGLRGEYYIDTNQYVGFGYVDGINLTILPKVFNRARKTGVFDERDEIIAFIRMLDTVLQLKLKESYAMLKKRRIAERNIHEIFMYLYTLMLHRELQSGVYRRYTRRVYDEPFLKGKLLMSKQIRKLPHQLTTFTQEYYKLSMDNELNRTLLLASKICEELSRYRDTVSNAKIISHILSEVTGYRDTSILTTRREVVFNRLNERFRRPYNLAKILLNNIEVGAGKEAYGFFIKMEELFEKFIYEILKKHLHEYEVKYQDTVGHLLRKTDNSGGKIGAQKPDITISKNNVINLIVDVKYKPVEEKEDWKPYIVEGDIRQLYIYTKLAHKRNRKKGYDNLPDALLIYPYLERAYNTIFDKEPKYEYTFNIEEELNTTNKLIISRYNFKNLINERDVTDKELIKVILDALSNH